VDVVRVDFLSAFGWVLSFAFTVLFTKMRGLKLWLLLLSAPFALFPAAEVLFIFLIWKLNGFAP
jgi:hypothetical protein